MKTRKEMRTKDKRRNVNLTPGERRLLNDLVRFEKYQGQLASEDTLRTAISAGLVRVIGENDVGRPYVRPTRKGERHQARGGVPDAE